MAETPELAAALNASANSWSIMNLSDPAEVLRPNNAPGSKPTTVPNPLAKALDGLAKAVDAVKTDVAAIRAESGTVGLTDAQVAAIGAQVTEALGARLVAIEDAVDKLMAAARAAGNAVG